MANDYIRREDAVDAVRETFKRIPTTAIRAMDTIKAIPSADVVQVVRCKDCIHHAYDEIFSCYWCEHPGMAGEVKPDFYCAYGKKREE